MANWNVISWGSKPEMSADIRLRIQFANFIGLVLGLVIFCVTQAVASPILITYYYVATGCFVLVPLVNRLGFHYLGRLLVSWTGVVVFLLVGTSAEIRAQDREMFYRLFIFGLIFIPLTVFTNKERFFQVVGAAVSVLSFFFYRWIDSVHNVIPYFPASNQANTDLLLYYVGPGILFSLIIASYTFFTTIEERSSKRVLELERGRVEALESKETELRLAVEQAERLYNETKASEETLRHKNQELAQQTDRLEEARNNMRRLVKRLRIGQVQLEEKQTQLSEKQFVDAGLARLSEAARYQSGQETQAWASKVLRTLMDSLEAANASIFQVQHLHEGVRAVQMGGLALAANNGTARHSFEPGQGTIGAVMQTGEQILTSWPYSSEGRIATSLFSFHPNEIYTLPLKFNGVVLGILEVSALKALEHRERSFLLRIPEVLGPALHALSAQVEIARLLLEAQTKAEALLSQEEEMRQNIEELESTQENMRRAQLQLEAQEANLNAVLNNTEDSIVLLDTKYRVVLANKAIQNRYKNYGVELVIGQDIRNSIQSATIAEKWTHIYDRSLAGEAQQFQDTRIDDGELRYVDYSVNPVFSNAGVIIGVSVFSRDVTERASAQTALQEGEAALRRLNETLEEQVEIRTRELALNASILGTTLETTRDGILVVDAQNHITTYNQQFLDLWQLAQDITPRLQVEGGLKFILPLLQDAALFSQHVQDVETENPPYSETTIFLKDNRVISVYSQRPTSQTSDVGRVWGFADITDFHRAQLNLRDSETRLRRFFELAHEGLLFHEGGIIFDSNPTLGHILGYPLEEILGQPFTMFIAEQDVERARVNFQTGNNTPIELCLRRKDGSVIDCEVVANSLFLDGRTVRAVGVRDITERKAAEGQMLAIARATPVPLLIFRHDDAIILYVNERFEQLLGLTMDDVRGVRSKILFYYEADKARIRDDLRATGGRLQNYEICAKRADGTPVWVVLNSERTIFKGEDAVLFGFYDITERRTQEQLVLESKKQVEDAFSELKEAREQLSLSEKLASLGQLVAGVAHEINTPVAAVGSSAKAMREVLPSALDGMVQLLGKLNKKETALFSQFVGELYIQHDRLLTSRDERELRRRYQTQFADVNLPFAEEAARKLVEVNYRGDVTRYIPLLQGKHGEELLMELYRIGQNFHTLENLVLAADKTRTIVGALKRFTYAGRGSQDGAEHLERVSLLDSLNTIVILYSHQIRKTALLNTTFEGDLIVIADADRLGQVWTNLITNALQAMPKGGELTLELLDQRIGETIYPGNAIVRVTDTGSGIPPKVLPRIFEAFFTTKPKGEGTGIGLHISKQILEGYGGRIEVESQPGNTTFSIFLPLAPPEA